MINEIILEESKKIMQGTAGKLREAASRLPKYSAVHRDALSLADRYITVSESMNMNDLMIDERTALLEDSEAIILRFNVAVDLLTTQMFL